MRTYGNLREQIRKHFGSIGVFAVALGRERSTISKKLNGVVPWDQNEIEKCCELLHISKDNIPAYFFYES